MSIPDPIKRKEESRQTRIDAAQKAYNRNHPIHRQNSDEAFPYKFMNFTKGLPHNTTTGLIMDEDHYEKFKEGICGGDPEVIRETPLGPHENFATMSETQQRSQWQSESARVLNKVRAWESAGAGLAFDLQGPDAQAVTMRRAPKLGSNLQTAEIAEVYFQAVLRDIPFNQFGKNSRFQQCVDALNNLTFFRNENRNGAQLTPETAFRGFTQGDLTGPYISQFLLAGNNGRQEEFKVKDGYINYGSILIDQRVRAAKPINYLTDWQHYIDVQNGADFQGQEEYEESGVKRRFIASGRDLATYVHYDALYEAYLNACLLMLDWKVPFDEGVPFQGADLTDKQQGFALYGGPHILSLVTEVATRALKAVRFQKFNIHRRLRPEALAARIEKKDEIVALMKLIGGMDARNGGEALNKTFKDLSDAGVFDVMEEAGIENHLLPMAFAEGSPMHPTYGAGHATVAGACVTILKAFFKTDLYFNLLENGTSMSFVDVKPSAPEALVATNDGKSLKVVPSDDALRIDGELNKLAANISIGRNWAGVHYYSDYTESMLMGEKIAIGILEEQILAHNQAEEFHLHLNRFNGDRVRIDRTGTHVISAPSAIPVDIGLPIAGSSVGSAPVPSSIEGHSLNPNGKVA